MELNMSIGTIDHLASGRKTGSRSGMILALAVAAMVGVSDTPVVQAMDRDMKRILGSNLKVKKRNLMHRTKVTVFKELPKKDINAFDILEVKNSVKDMKATVGSTLFSIFMIYKNEETTTEINEIGIWDNQHVAQFIHGAYAILEKDLLDVRDHFTDTPKQAGNMNTLAVIRQQITRNHNNLVNVLSAPEASGSQIISPEALTAVREFKNIQLRIHNLLNKIDAFSSTKKV